MKLKQRWQTGVRGKGKECYSSYEQQGKGLGAYPEKLDLTIKKKEEMEKLENKLNEVGTLNEYEVEKVKQSRQK